MKREGKAMNSRINDNMEIEYECANCKKTFSFRKHGVSYSKEIYVFEKFCSSECAEAFMSGKSAKSILILIGLIILIFIMFFGDWLWTYLK